MIPIRNLYYLFLYAWDQFPSGTVGEIGIDKSPDLPNLFAKLLLAGTRRLLRRGLDRGYRALIEELPGLRGRLRLDRMVKESTQLRGNTVCEYDELSHDTLHHQVLKATLINLARCSDVENDTQHDLRSLAHRFHDVSDLRLSASCFRRFVFSRNNREYIFLMRLCEFVFQSLMPDQRGVGARFQQVLDDEAVMSKVFEEFLRKFFELNRREYRVRSESFKWLVSNTSEDDLGFLPDMLTDITLRHSSHTVIVDAKFYKQPLVRAHHGDRERVRSQHLYQLVTYLQHERKRGGGKGLAGVLIYPDVGRSLRLRYQLLEIPVLVSTIDLGREWYDIEAELNALLDDCASAAVLAGSGLVSDQTFRSGSVPIVSSLKVAPPPGPLSRG